MKMNNAFPVSHQVFEDVHFQELPLSAKLLYIQLSKLSNRYADKNGWFWVSNKTLAENIKISTPSVVAAKKALKRGNFLEYLVTTFTNTKTLKATIYRLNHFLDISKYDG